MRKAKNWRKIVVENKTYRYKIGNSNIVIQNEDGKRVGPNRCTHFDILGYFYDDKYTIPITPSMIEQYIWKHT